REITPLLGEHRRLLESSLRRKIAGLRGAVADDLEALLERHLKRPGGRSRVDAEAAQRSLDEGDRAIGEARKRSQDWSTDRRDFLDGLLWDVARAVAEAGGGQARRVISETLSRRGRAARESVLWLFQTLSHSLDGMRRASPSASAEVDPLKD